MSYFPVDRNITTSSLWIQGSPAECKLWIYMMLNADPRSGIINETIPALAQRNCLPIPEVEAILEKWSGPDPYSRTQDHDGARIRRIPAGLLLLNYRVYQAKDYSTPRVKRWRERLSDRDSKITVTETKNKNKNSNGSMYDGSRDVGDGLPPVLPPEQRAEESTRATIRSLQLRLGALLCQLAEHPNSRQMVPAWCRAVTAYTRKDGTEVRGVADYRTLMSIDRLEKSIADAEWHLTELEKGVQHGTYSPR